MNRAPGARRRRRRRRSSDKGENQQILTRSKAKFATWKQRFFYRIYRPRKLSENSLVTKTHESVTSFDQIRSSTAFSDTSEENNNKKKMISVKRIKHNDLKEVKKNKDVPETILRLNTFSSTSESTERTSRISPTVNIIKLPRSSCTIKK